MAIVRGGITVKDNVQAFANAVESAGFATSFSTYPGHSPPEGPTQALDIFTPDNDKGYKLQDAIVELAEENQRRFGVRYCIRRRQIWNVERKDEGWRSQTKTGNRTADHYDHVHITFYVKGDGPYGRDEPPVACEDRVFKLGDSDRCIHYIQRLLLKRGYTLADDGDYGPRTEYVIRRYQRSNDLSPDGIVGPETWAALWKGLTLIF